MKNIFKKIYVTRFIIGLVTGAAGGFAYYYFIGCSSGTCAITSNPYISTFYGMFMGGLLTFKIKRTEKPRSYDNM